MTPGAVILIALGGALLLEGIGWAVYPGGLRRLYSQMIGQMSDKDLHLSGLISVFIGVILIAIALKFAA